MGGKPRKERTPWLAVRREFDEKRNGTLTLLSFLLPLGIWCLVSYCPFIWHPKIKLDIAANRDGVNTVFVSGDQVGRDFLPEFQEAIRHQNQSLRELAVSGSEPEGRESSRRRANRKILKQIGSVAVSNGWITPAEADNEEAILSIWEDLATGRKIASRPTLSRENLEIVKENWGTISASATFPDEPLLQLIPSGVPANPDYLPPPHRVLIQGVREFTRSSDQVSDPMGARLVQSLKIVFTGFFIACLIGIPIGVLCGTFAIFSRLIEPFVDFFRYMPAPTFSTLLVAVFLANDAPKVALVVIGTVFQMVLIVSKTTRLLDVSLLEAAQTLGARQHQLLKRVVIPGILPDLYNDLRILLGWAWTWLVIAELVGVKSGLTEFIETQGRFRNFDRVFPIIIMIGVIGFVTDQVLAWLRPLLFPWLAQHRKRRPNPITRTLTWFPRWVLSAGRERSQAMAAIQPAGGKNS